MRFFEFKTHNLIFESAETIGNTTDQFFKDIKDGSIDPVIADEAIAKISQLVTPEKPPQDKELETTALDKEPQIPTTEDLTYSPQNASELRKVLMKQGANSQEVMDVITFAYRKNIVKNCNTLMATKLYKPEAADLLAALFYELPATFPQRNALSGVLNTTGIINLNKLKKAGNGALIDLLMDSYKSNKAAVNLFIKLKNRKDFPTKVSAANKGAGEDLIAILGHPVQKLSPGDLNVDGLEIEVKAMGARLKGFGGPDTYGNPLSQYDSWANKVQQALGKRGALYLQDNNMSLKKYFNFGKNNLLVLSAGLEISEAKNKKNLLVTAFDDLLQTLYPLSTTGMREIILKSFTDNGLNVEDFRKNWFLFSYDYYMLTTTDKKTDSKMFGIMFINQSENTYQLVTSSDEISKNWDNYELSSDLFTWNNPTGQAPKITYGKETRERRKRI